MKICAAISETSVVEAVTSGINSAALGADLVEIRFDALSELPEDLSVFQKIPLPKIATLRTPAQGGNCQLTEEERQQFFTKCSASFEYLDLEYDSPLAKLDFDQCEKIVSYHDFSKTPTTAEIVEIINNLQKIANIAKAAFYIHSVSDLYELIKAAEVVTGRYILIGMGELGELTRICCDKLGSEITYAAPQKGKETAPGQIDVCSLKNIEKDYFLAGIIGNPVSHSRSPAMHNAAFKSLDIGGRYLRFKCEEEELSKIVEIVKILGIRGLNITIPHKQAVINYLDELDEKAKLAGAVNCLINDDKRLKGTNTDIAGFRESFRAIGAEVRGKKALIIGAGGAARACATFLAQAQAQIYIINRTPQKAEKLAAEFGGTVVNAITEDFDIIINCTPMGMEGYADDPSITDNIFHEQQIVMDAVPVPEITTFLEKAKRNRATTISGREMLIYQAIDAFEVWSGQKPDYSIMSEAYGEKR
ncbi:shikimate dehydrogenase [Candidatus Methanomassiliicoccus intestinalis]|uniref:shikimate dehydrogenase n=1 Tax=Candidatus Methanomassiliicoccus intestinalis TaxID=1406512 RepID=UPI0037DC1548